MTNTANTVNTTLVDALIALKQISLCTLIGNKIGESSVQQWLLTIVNSLESDGLGVYQDKSNFKEKLDEACQMLDIWIENNYVQVNKNLETKAISIIPLSSSIQQAISAIKEYTILVNKCKVNNKNSILKGVKSLSHLSHKPKQVIEKQNSIPILINYDNIRFSDREDILKNGSNDQTDIETQLIDEYINTYHQKVIFMNNKYDRRGRLYSLSYPISFQQDKYVRSSFELYSKEVCSSEGLINLKLDIANIIGYDKLERDKKLELVDKFLLSYDGYGYNTDGLDIDNVARIESALKAYEQAIRGEPIGYLASIDATASGSQLCALLTKNKTEAKFTNLTSEDKRYDIYSEVAKEFYRLKGHKETEIDSLAIKDRKRFKSSVMISGYNGKSATKKDFGSGRDLALFYQSYGNICKGANELTEIVNQAFLDNVGKTYMCWIMPDGFQVVVPQERTTWTVVKSKYYSATIKYYTHNPSLEENKRSLMPNFIHSCDAYICREVIRRCPFEVLTVHDSFYTHPNNISEVLRVYNEILQEINSGEVDILSQFLTDIYGEKKENPFKDVPPLDDIRCAKYSLC